MRKLLFFLCFFQGLYFLSTHGKACGDDWIVVLGTGGVHGSTYKKAIFKTVKQENLRILLCVPKETPLRAKLESEGLVHEVFSVSPEDQIKAFETIKQYCGGRNIRAFFTVREDWLSIASQLSKAWNFPYQDPEAFLLAQNKEETRKKLEADDLKSIPYAVLVQKELEREKRPFDRPFFIKPRDGIRSEFVRRIASQEDWECYVQDVHGHNIQHFLAELEITGHEVDVDMFLHKGEMLYASVSDNFPPFKPFSLETGQLSPSILHSSVQEEVTAYAEKVVRALNFTDGNLHIEIMVPKDGSPVLIEVNGRLGGMYITFWHQELWGVDLIRAQLALALGKDPKPFLQKRIPQKAFAQLCVTSNTDGPLSLEAGDMVLGWKNHEAMLQKENVESASLWDPLPFEIQPKANGHPNLGEITISGKTPLEAFHNLLALCAHEPPLLQTSRGDIASSVWALRSFGGFTPGLERFPVKGALQEDIPPLQELLQSITSRASGSLEDLPKQSHLLVARDALTPNKDIVGMIAYHTWDQLRGPLFKRVGYIQDLVIAERYRRLGIASNLVKKAKRLMQKEGVSKITLAYEDPETPSSSPFNCFYGDLGFSSVGVFMTQYLPRTPFDETLLAQEGDWLYGQHLIETYCLSQGGDALGLCPDYKVMNRGALSTSTLSGLSGTWFVKFSRRGRDFLGDGIRGGNTSRGRVINMNHPEQALLNLQGFISSAPDDTQKIILQQVIDQAGGCLFHFEGSDHQSDIDLLWETAVCTGRYYAIFKNGKWMGDESIEGTGKGLPGNRKEAAREIFKRLKQILQPLREKFQTRIWSVEGFWNPKHEKVTFLQLRPTPLDRPIGDFSPPKDIFYETYFSWGVYETAPFILERDVFPADVFLSNDSQAKQLPPKLIQRLRQEKKTLFIHHARGFVLSHEPWFLPPPELRKHFAFLYVPEEILTQYIGEKVQFLANGRKGYGILSA